MVQGTGNVQTYYKKKKSGETKKERKERAKAGREGVQNQDKTSVNGCIAQANRKQGGRRGKLR